MQRMLIPVLRARMGKNETEKNESRTIGLGCTETRDGAVIELSRDSTIRRHSPMATPGWESSEAEEGLPVWPKDLKKVNDKPWSITRSVILIVRRTQSCAVFGLF